MSKKSESFRIRQEQLKKIREKYSDKNKDLTSSKDKENNCEE